ncbi:uncharacterized protein [Dermacentor albipictus]|uniref:uncharacterized protein isoform X3 n=1 Tax=Dermacentor albipictus TaxID=60249 RepID=UPI0031FC0C22
MQRPYLQRLSGPHLTTEDVCEIHWRRSSRHAPRRQLGSRRLRCHIQVVQSTLSLRASCFVLALAKKIASPEKEHFSAAASWTCRVDTQGISGSCIVCHLVIVPSETVSPKRNTAFHRTPSLTEWPSLTVCRNQEE